MTPGTPPTQVLSNATQYAEARGNSVMRHQTSTQPDGSGEPACYYPSVLLSSKVYIPTSTQPSGRWLNKPPGGGDVGDSSRQC